VEEVGPLVTAVVRLQVIASPVIGAVVVVATTLIITVVVVVAT
jgi:hypothetical protein